MSNPLLSIIVPIYNEEKIVSESLSKIFSLALEKEVIIVNDGSTDKTEEILKEMQNRFSFLLINQKTNQGKGAAVKKGLTKITGQYFVICDADLEYEPNDLEKLIKEANSQTAVFGSRFLEHRPKTFHYFINFILTSFFNILFGTHLTDMETCFKLIPSSSLEKINLSGRRFEIEPELTSQILKAGYKIKEIPISYQRRGYKDGKKINWRDGVLAIITIIKERYTR
jgi:glycosyltransferase involved in cell wall biosynthesis